VKALHRRGDRDGHGRNGRTRTDDGTLVVPSEYLEVVATRR
jgi:hypothetical protein